MCVMKPQCGSNSKHLHSSLGMPVTNIAILARPISPQSFSFHIGEREHTSPNRILWGLNEGIHNENKCFGKP